MSDYCNATPAGESWPVYSRPQAHDGDHESADFRWAEGGQAQPKVAGR